MDVKKITRRNISNFMFLMEGYGKALKEQNLVNITGETAIMKHSITAFCDLNSDSQLTLVWGATCIGLANKKLLLNPANIKPGMIIVGFKDPGYGCNGGTFFTNLILRKWGPCIDDILEDPEAMEFVKKLAVPSKIYAKTVCRIVGWKENGKIGEPLAKIAGIAHITGGGVWGKFGEILPPGVGAYLYNMPDPPQVLLEAQELSFEFPDLKLSGHSGYGTLHGGCRMLLVTHSFDDANKIIYEAAQDGIEAQIVGETDDSSKLKINSKYLNGGMLEEELKR
jgi:phosphoribosylaminoimidazole (AIR) synthetase